MFRLLSFRVSYLLLFVGLVLWVPFLCVAQVPNYPHDPALIDKIEKGDFMHISDDNNGRMDLLAVLMGASRSHCEVFPSVVSIAKYVKYLGSDSVTGKYPSQEFELLGLLGAFVSMGDDGGVGGTPKKESSFDGPWLLNPNAQAVMVIGSHGCNDPRFQKFATNLLNAIEHHVNWHDQKLGDKAPLMSQNATLVAPSAWRDQVTKDVELNKQTQVMKQIADLQAAGATYVNCVYGPKNPDSTGTDQVGFWYKQVPTPGGEFMKVSWKNPMSAFGDIPLSTCPANLMEAHQKNAESRRMAQSKVDPSALPPAPVPLQLMMGQYYLNYQYVKKSWVDYQNSHNAKDQQAAIDQKAMLLRTYNRSCNIEKSAPGGGNGEFCQLVRQLTDEFQEIPDGPLSSAVPNTQGPQIPSLQTSQSTPTPNLTRPQPNPRIAQTQTPAPRTPPAAVPAVPERTNPAAGGTPNPANQRTAAPDTLSGYPVGTRLMVAITDPVDLSAMAGRTFRAQLARPAQYGTQILAPQGSEVELQVSAPETSANGNMVTVTVSVVSVTVDGKRIPVTTQPIMRPISMAGGRNPGISQIPARNILPFIVRAAN